MSYDPLFCRVTEMMSYSRYPRAVMSVLPLFMMRCALSASRAASIIRLHSESWKVDLSDVPKDLGGLWIAITRMVRSLLCVLCIFTDIACLPDFPSTSFRNECGHEHVKLATPPFRMSRRRCLYVLETAHVPIAMIGDLCAGDFFTN